MQGRDLTQKEIKAYLNARFYDNDKKFETLPKKLLAFTSYTNKVFVFDKQEYKDWSLKINSEILQEQENNPKDDKYMLALWHLCFTMYNSKEITQAKLTKLLPLGKNKVAEFCTNLPPPANN
jgi:hypothetical protein